MAASRRTTSPQHILLLGASGISGLAFIKEHLAIPDRDPNKPYLTLYIRASGRSKLNTVFPSAISDKSPAPKIRIVEGSLDDRTAIRKALSSDNDFPKVTTVISVLGAYMSLYHFLTRTKPTPITNAIDNNIVPAMLEMDIKRILVLSTHSAFPNKGEFKQSSWKWYLNSFIPLVVVPQGHAEMKGIAYAVADNSSSQVTSKHGLEATVFRIPMLEEGSSDLDVSAFVIGGEGNTENMTISRGSLARWLLKEVDERKWVDGAPMLANTTAS